MTVNKLISFEQFGFRPGHSTELAAIRLIDHLVKQMDQRRIPMNIYLDLSKAFDTLDHAILLSKLNYYGISATANTLFRNYLSDRHQYVEFSSSQSELFHGGASRFDFGAPVISCLYKGPPFSERRI